MSLAEWRAGQRDVVAYVRRLEAVLIAALADFGIDATRVDAGYTGRLGRRREDRGDRREGRARAHAARLRAQCRSRPRDVRPHRSVRHPRSRSHVDGAAARRPRSTARGRRRVVARFAEAFGFATVDRQDVAWQGRRRSRAVHRDGGAPVVSPVRLLGSARSRRGRGRPGSRCAAAGVDAGQARGSTTATSRLQATMRRPRPAHGLRGSGLPEHLRVLGRSHRDVHDPRRSLHAGVRLLPGRHAQAARRRRRRAARASPKRSSRLGLAHAVITCVARDDLPDGGASAFAATVARDPGASTPRRDVEVLIPDCKGDAAALDTIFAAAPDVLNHNLETVARLQRAGAPVGRATHARSPLLAPRKAAGLVTKSGIILGMGETVDEVRGRARRPARGRRRHHHARPVPAAVGGPPSGRAVVDARRVRRGRAATPCRSASATSRPGRSCAPATTPAPRIESETVSVS